MKRSKDEDIANLRAEIESLNRKRDRFVREKMGGRSDHEIYLGGAHEATPGHDNRWKSRLDEYGVVGEKAEMKRYDPSNNREMILYDTLIAEKFEKLGHLESDPEDLHEAAKSLADAADKCWRALQDYGRSAKLYARAAHLEEEGEKVLSLDDNRVYDGSIEIKQGPSRGFFSPHEEAKRYHKLAKMARRNAALERVLGGKKMSGWRKNRIRKSKGYPAVVLLFLGLLTFSLKITGNVIGASSVGINFLGAILVLIGLIGSWFFVQKKKYMAC